MIRFIFLVVNLSGFIPHGAALIECRDPAFSSQLFFDLAQLQLMAIQHREHIQTPTNGSAENGTSSCASQLCCGDEVGCCFRDPDSGRHTCGCKDAKDLECSRSAPLSVIRNYGCEPHKMSEISMCFRRVRKGEHSEPSVSAHFGVRCTFGLCQYEKDTTLLGEGTVVSPAVDQVGETVGDVTTGTNGVSPGDLVNDIGPGKLLNMLNPDVLDYLVEQVADRKRNGLPYGRQILPARK